MRDYINDIRELQKTLTDYMNQISENRTNDELCFTLCCKAQQKMIELGTLLETEGNLGGSKIINWLEVACEFFYQLSNGVITIDVMKQYMICKIKEGGRTEIYNVTMKQSYMRQE